MATATAMDMATVMATAMDMVIILTITRKKKLHSGRSYLVDR